MNLVLSVHFRQSYFEYFLPGENNRVLEVEIPAAVSGFPADVALALEVWEEQWFLCENADVQFGERVSLRGGLRIDCVTRKSGRTFVVIIEDVPAEYTAFAKYRLTPGRVTIGREPSNNICFNLQKLVSSSHALLEVTPDRHCTVTDNSQNGTFVNGKRINGSKLLCFGDTVGIFGLKLVYLGDVIAVNRPTLDCVMNGLMPYEPPPAAPALLEEPAEAFYQRSPRLVEKLDDEAVEIEAPPSLSRGRRQPLMFTVGPAMTMVIPMAAGAMFTMFAARQSGQTAGAFMFMGIVTSVTAAFIGIFWALINVRYQKRAETEETAKRETLFAEYLERIRADLTQKHADNREILDRLYPCPREYLSFAQGGGLRLWERSVNHQDFLSLRLGVGNLPAPNPIQTPKEKFTMITDALADAPQQLRRDFLELKDVPICLSLHENRLVGVIGGDCLGIARLLATQIAAYHAYTDVNLAFLMGESLGEHSAGFHFARWLPHVWSGETRMIAGDANGAGDVLYQLSEVLRARLQEREERRGTGRPLPHYVVFVSDPSLIEGEAIAKYLYNPVEELGLSVVLLYGEIGRLPNNCTVIIRQDEQFTGYCSLDSAFDNRAGVVFDRVTDQEAETFSRLLSAVRVREEQSAGTMPASLSFLDMYHISRAEELNIYRNWLENRTFESMKAMIGYRGADAPLYLDIHEKYHGPHGLVAGTTGSGKSETLQTYILSLAVNFDPREISFILIDYKGGGMAQSFSGLPHIAGVITNLGGNQTNRALASVNSEIKRRQTTFNEFGVKHIDEYIELFRSGRAGKPMPHLLIIADEFAELKKEQAEFVYELVSVARVGRSLGVHLILATQKPDGVVDDEIWSNTKFQLCLRVQDKKDSQAMIRRPDAAYINQVGRGYFRVGNDEIFELFQSGWSGANYEPEIPYSQQVQHSSRMINLWGKTAIQAKQRGPKQGGEKKSQLRAVVEHIAAVAAGKNIHAISDIWLAPLAERVTLADLQAFPPVKGSLYVPLGFADDPARQRQFTYGFDFIAEGTHLMIAGAGGSGKTTLLQTVLYAYVTQFTPEQVNVYIADFNSRTLGVFGGLPHVGGVIYDDALDRADKLMLMLSRELARRVAHFSARGVGSFKEYAKLYDDVPAIVFAIDNFASFAENCPKHEDALTQMTRQCASYGIYFMITCTNAGEVRGRIRQNIGCGIGLQLSDRFAYEEVVKVRPTIMADNRITGRGLVLCGGEVLEMQTALALDAVDSAAMNAAFKTRFAAIAEDWRAGGAPQIRHVPEDMSADHLFTLPEIAETCRSGRYMPLGYDLAEAVPLYVDLGATFCFTIGGGPKSGKTTLLKALMTAAKRQGCTGYVFDGALKELMKFAGELDFGYLTRADALYDFFSGVIVPEFRRRSAGKMAFIQGGGRDLETYLASESKICLFINDFSALCEAIYTSERDMKGFLEQMLTAGAQHMIYLFACVSANDMNDEWNTKPLLRKFIGYKEGLHLGGNTDGQRIFDFDVPVLLRGSRLPAGQGHIVDGGATKRITAMTV
jgi:S-DNA-T family DNA segregation ATPase FtsK/SpoIIIE